MITVRRSIVEEIESLLALRKETLCKVNNLPSDYPFDSVLVEFSRGYFLNGNQTTVVAEDDGKLIGCASLSYIEVMPTLKHPTGIRAHLMNVYVKEEYRRQGIARQMIKLLIDEALLRGVTEITLDATEAGRPLYESLGFTGHTEGMILTLNTEK